MTPKTKFVIAGLSWLVFSNTTVAAVIETVPVGNAGNPDDVQGNFVFGSVPYDYRIGKYEVTNDQYVEFLNHVDPLGANSLLLYNGNMTDNPSGGIVLDPLEANGAKYLSKLSQENNPVVFVSWYDSLRFANWLHNGQGSSDTENGAYDLANAPDIVRNPGARWVLPNVDEWYKAAFHKNDGVTGNYWDYATSSDVMPFSDQPPGTDAPTLSDTANFSYDDGVANGYDDGFAVSGSTITPTDNGLTDVGAYSSSVGPYGTFDQDGNAREWTDIPLFLPNFRAVLGGSWDTGPSTLGTSGLGSGFPAFELVGVGFRVVDVTVPEPPSLPLMVVAIVGLLLRNRTGDMHSLASV